MLKRISVFITVAIFVIGFVACEYQTIKPFPEEVIPDDNNEEVIPPVDTTKVTPPVDTTKVTPGDTTKVTPPVDTTKVTPPVDTTKVTPPTPVLTVSFSKDVLPSLVSNCSACHTSKKPYLSKDKAYKSLTGDGYVNTKDPAASKLLTKINEGHQTSKKLSAAQKKAILTWITEGATNN
jgi:hypothetical protein